MDFFTHQDKARKNTFLLLVYYVIAVCFIVLAVYGVLAFVLLGEEDNTYIFKLESYWDPELLLLVISGTLLIIMSGTIFKVLQLASSGGQALATTLGGRRILQTTMDPDEKKVINVVEEMAIAAGLPVPPVFVLESEKNINAFAAGFSHHDAVIGVTRGCIKNLSRDELQGVIAHEFSHILNGDMRLNLKLIGILNGILIIALIGYWLMYLTSNRGSASLSKGKKGSNPLPLLGLLLMIVGYIGVFFGNLIKAAVSRQREFLADASAVQFTRNPSGISGALKKIGGYSSLLNSSKAQEISHMFFANGVTGFFAGYFATHPPLKERIRRIDGSFQEKSETTESHTNLFAAQSTMGFVEQVQSVTKFRVNPEEMISKVGTLTADHVAYASMIYAKIPLVILDLVKTSSGAMSVTYALLLDNKAPRIREQQLAIIKERVDISTSKDTFQAFSEVSKIWYGLRLPLIDLTMQSLKLISKNQYELFAKNIVDLVSVDNKVKLFEYTVTKIILRNLGTVFGKSKLSLPQRKNINVLLNRCRDLLSFVAYSSACDIKSAKLIFDMGAEKINPTMKIRDPIDCTTELLDITLNELTLATPSLKRMIIEACIACTTIDNEITVEESELLRAIGEALCCPIPPLLPGKV